MASKIKTTMIKMKLYFLYIVYEENKNWKIKRCLVFLV